MNRKYYVLMLTLLLIIFIVCIFFRNSNVDYQKQYISKLSDELNITQEEMNAKEQYVHWLASELGVTYEKAYKINEEEDQKYISNKNNVRVHDEVVKYKTIRRNHRYHPQLSKCKVQISCVVKYVYSKAENKAIEIIRVGSTNIVLKGECCNTRIDAGTPDIEYNNNNSFRVGRLAAITTEVTSFTTISDCSNFQVFEIGGSGTGYQTYRVTSDSIEYVVSGNLNSL